MPVSLVMVILALLLSVILFSAFNKAWCKRIFTAGGKIMGTVLRCVRADYLKAKRSMLNVIYIIVPLILALAFAGYFHISSWNRTLKISAFL